ncbi:MAG TPA: hypothetical protein EYP55_09835 [Anaerolineae bacterium]|nr:hypothetical protein [Anaerolineae bacterium]
MKEKVLAQLKKTFRPEFLNRVDKIIVFKALTREELKQIVDIQLKRLGPRLEEQGLKLEVSEEAKAFIAREGYDPDFGARPLRRAIQYLIEDPLSEGLLSGEFQPGDVVVADVEGGEIVLRVKERAEAPPLAGVPA